MRKYYFIVNPKAGNGKCIKKWRKLEERLLSLQVHYKVYYSKWPGHAMELAKKIAEDHAGKPIVLIAVGGDGTAHEVLNGIGTHPSITFSFIPGGSGNDFSRGFSLPREAGAALDDLIGKSAQDAEVFDCGRVSFPDSRNRLFINNMGVGFDALVSRKANESRMKALFNRLSLGRLVYVYILLKELTSYKLKTIELTIDGNRHIYEQTWFVTVSNQPFYGGGMIISPAADTSDGILDITVVHRLSRAKLLLVFMSVFWGKHIYFKEVHTFKGRNIAISSSSPVDVHTDGEYIGRTQLANARVLPGAFKILSKLREQLIGGEANGFS
ncbi:diacylglycerol kinase [Bacillus sp. FJAT-27225]|nr:diacylglycerol kinase [Bacillus sp. FJAT-27225]